MPTVIFVTSGTGQTSPSDWDNSNNSIEGIGAGGSGGFISSSGGHGTGGGGGEYRKIANFSVATPGTTSFTYVIGTGTGVSASSNTVGVAGTDTTFNTTSLIAKGGQGGAAGSGNRSGGAGGTGGTGAAGNADGGRGGNLTNAAGTGASGGGGAGGPNGAGVAGADSPVSTSISTNGGAGDAGFGGAGGVAAGTPTGVDGQEWDATHGSGGGSAGRVNGNGVAAGLYGGGTGASTRSTAGSGSTQAGRQGIIVITYTPVSSGNPFSANVIDPPPLRRPYWDNYSFTADLNIPLMITPNVSNMTWPNPVVRQITNDQRGFINPAEVQLIGQDSFFGLAGNPNFDWPLPPFYQRPRRSIDALTLNNPLGLQTIMSLPQPFLQTNWPLPPRPVRGAGDYSWAWGNPNVYAPVVVTGSPFFQTDWPLPFRQRRPASELSWSWYNLATYAATLPFNKFDWPLPARPRRSVDALTTSNPIGLPTIMALPKPFLQTDWPVPPKPRRSIDALSWAFPTPSLLAAQPFRQTDWPVPPKPRRSIDALTWAMSAYPGAITGNPFHQTDWPLPIPQRYGISLRTHLDPLKINLLGKDQFFGPPGMGPRYDYPNPRAPHFPLSLRGHIGPFNVNGALVFVQTVGVIAGSSVVTGIGSFAVDILSLNAEIMYPEQEIRGFTLPTDERIIRVPSVAAPEELDENTDMYAGPRRRPT